MLKRFSVVNSINIISLTSSSQLQIGDSSINDLNSRTFAVQREKELFFGHEGDFNAYDIFKKPVYFLPINESFIMTKRNMGNQITVNQLKVIGITSSSIVQIGSNDYNYGETRIKNTRQFGTETIKFPEIDTSQ